MAYGAIRAMQGISFHIEQGEIVTLIGANGAGKSTTLRTISGLLRPLRGDILYQEQEPGDASPLNASSDWASRRCRRGARSFPR